MASQLETIGGLERRLTLSVSPADLASKVQERFRSLARSVRMPGFRPGKVPLKLIEQSYGPQVKAEILGDLVGKAFNDAVAEHKLRVAGQPSIAPAAAGAAAAPAAAAPAGPTDQAGAGTDPAGTGPAGNITDPIAAGFVATFEVYPDVVLGTPDTLEVERFTTPIGDAEVDKTIEVLRKQRTRWHAVERAGQDGDRITIDFTGTIDGAAFEGGSGRDVALVLGEGRMLADFEAGVRGHAAGAATAFELRFPDDYGAKEVAGKTARFEVTVKQVEAPELPAVDEDFARQMGVENGDVAKFRADVRANLEREVAQRVRARTKASVIDKVVGLARIELPKALVEQEAQALAQRALDDLKGRGVDITKLPLPTEVFRDQAERRVRVGLIVAEAVKANALQAKPEQIRSQIEEFAQTYENPSEVVRWYFSDRKRLAEVEALVVEQNVVDWVLASARVTDRALSFDELMATPS